MEHLPVPPLPSALMGGSGRRPAPAEGALEPTAAGEVRGLSGGSMLCPAAMSPLLAWLGGRAKGVLPDAAMMQEGCF